MQARVGLSRGVDELYLQHLLRVSSEPLSFSYDWYLTKVPWTISHLSGELIRHSSEEQRPKATRGSATASPAHPLSLSKYL
jgi:hypothetical protein